MRTWLAAAVLVCLGWPAWLGGQQPPGKWQLDTAVGRCTLLRSFPGSSVTAVALSTTPGSGRYDLTLAGKALHNRPAGARASVRIVFDAGPDAVEWPAGFARIEAGAAILAQGMAEDVVTRFGRAATVQMQVGTDVIGPVDLSNAAKGVAALKTCVGQQLVDWGADPA